MRTALDSTLDADTASSSALAESLASDVVTGRESHHGMTARRRLRSRQLVAVRVLTRDYARRILELDTPHGPARPHLHLVDSPVAALELRHGAGGRIDSPDLAQPRRPRRAARRRVPTRPRLLPVTTTAWPTSGSRAPGGVSSVPARHLSGGRGRRRTAPCGNGPRVAAARRLRVSSRQKPI
jgi:hypothetical protein